MHDDLADTTRPGKYRSVSPYKRPNWALRSLNNRRRTKQHLRRRSSNSKIKGIVDHLWDLPGQTVRRCWLLYIIMTYYVMSISAHLLWQWRDPYILWFPQKAQLILNKRSNFQENASICRKAQEFSQKHKLSRTHGIFHNLLGKCRILQNTSPLERAKFFKKVQIFWKCRSFGKITLFEKVPHVCVSCFILR
jgi:hypothetical protein